MTLTTGTALAQAPSVTLAAQSAASDPNPGAITLTTGVDFPSVYFFRGIRQEADPSFTMFAFGDVGIRSPLQRHRAKAAVLTSASGTVFIQGTSGTGTTDKKSHYEEDFYVMFNMGVGKGVTITPFFTSYTSPNGSFGTVNEFAFKVAHASRFAPYGIVAFELSGQADGGSEEGTYGEIGIGPSWPLGARASQLAFP